MAIQESQTPAKSGQHMVLAITGMTCAACAARIERTLKKQPGVVLAAVNLATERGWVEFRPGETSLDRLVHAVEQAGYGAREVPAAAEPSAQAADEHRERKEQEIRGLRNLTLFAAVLSAPLVFFGMLPAQGMGLLPLELHQAVVYVETVLAGIVWVYAGWRCHDGAVKNLRHGTANMDVLVSQGTTAAFWYSLYLALIVGGEAIQLVYYDSAAVIVTLNPLWALSAGQSPRPDLRGHQEAHEPASPHRAGHPGRPRAGPAHC